MMPPAEGRLGLAAAALTLLACAGPSAATAGPVTTAPGPAQIAWTDCAAHCSAACVARLESEAPTTLEAANAAATCGLDARALAAYERLWARGGRGCSLRVAIADLRARGGALEEALAFAEGDAVCRDLDLWIARAGRRFGAAGSGEGVEADAAGRAIARLLSRDPGDAAALTEQVERWIAAAQPALAETTCARAEDLVDAWLHDACARAAIGQGAQHAAERHFRQAAEASPNAAHLYNLGHFLLTQRRRADAAEAFRAALRVAPAHYEATVGLAAALIPECWAAARELLTRAMRAEPDRPDAFLTFGQMTLANPCADTAASAESVTALYRFVELAEGEPAHATDVERVTRRCRRAERSTRPRWRSSPWADGCEPGVIQSHELYCSSTLLDMQIRASRASPPAGCAIPDAPTQSE